MIKKVSKAFAGRYLHYWIAVGTLLAIPLPMSIIWFNHVDGVLNNMKALTPFLAWAIPVGVIFLFGSEPSRK